MLKNKNSFIFSITVLEEIKKNLNLHHKLYKRIRCKAEYLEELAVISLVSKGVEVEWRPSGHEKDKDILINKKNKIQIKSGTSNDKILEISGHRLGRFMNKEKEHTDKYFEKVTNYLNNSNYEIISFSDPISKNKQKKQFEKDIFKHIYEIRYVDILNLKNIKSNEWKKEGKQYKQTNGFGVEFSLRPSMSWQIWWKIPLNLTEKLFDISIN